MASASLTALLKQRFLNSKVYSAIPDSCVLQDQFPFTKSAEEGREAMVPVVVRKSGAFSVAAAGSTMSVTAGSPFVIQQAIAKSTQLGLEEVIGDSDAARASSDEKAFDIFQNNVLLPSLTSFRTRLEHQLLQGGYVGTVTAVTNTGATPCTITLANSWADAIFAGGEGTMTLDIFSAETGGSTRGTGVALAALDFDAKTINITGTATGIAAGDKIFIAGTRAVTAPSLREQLKNTSATMLGIDASSYPLWRANQHTIAASGTLSMTEVLKAVSKCVGRGAVQEDMILLVNPTTLQNLSSDQAALRTYDSSYKGGKAKNGFAGVTYEAAAGFSVSVVAHPLICANEAYLVAPSAVKRLGSAEVNMRGKEADSVTYTHPTTFATAYRWFAEQALAVVAPSQCAYISNANGTAL